MAEETPTPTTTAPTACPRCREFDRFVLVLCAVTEAAGGLIEVPKEIAERVQASDDLAVTFHQHEDGRVIVRTSQMVVAPPAKRVM